MAVFPLDTSVFSVVLFYFSASLALWNDMECHYQWQVASFILGYIHAEEDSPYGRGEAFLPMTEDGFFLGLGPWPSVDIDMGLLVFYPPQDNYKKKTSSV